ncbi:DUF3971 domain-containing protein [Bacteroidota bacterium]
MHWLKRIIFFLFLLLVFFIGVGLFINWKYADDLEAYVLDSIRSVVKTEISINDEAEFSLWKDFPLVAVELKDIYVQDSFESDTLLSAKRGFAQLNIFKILNNDFTIEGIKVSDGLLRLKRNQSGKWNFRVWKEPENNEKNVNFSIEILTLENIYLDYDDREIDLNVQFLSQKSRLKGKFTNDNQHFGLSLNGHMPSLNTAGKDRIIDLPLSLVGILNIDAVKNIYTVEMGNAVMAGNEMIWDVEWRKTDGGTNISLKVRANDIDPNILLPHLWPQIPEAITNLQLKGKSDLTVSLEGPFTKENGPELDAQIRMKNGHFRFQNTDINNLNLEGQLYMKDVKQSKAIKLTFNKFDLKTNQGSVQGSGILTDLSNPYISVKSIGTSRIEEILKVAEIKDGISGTGNVSWNLDFSGPLGQDFKTTNEDFKKMSWSGSVSFSEANMSFSEAIPPLTQLTGKVIMTAAKTQIEDCSGNLGHLNFKSQFNILNLKNVLTDSDYPVIISGDVKIETLDVGKLPSEWKFNSKTEGATKKVRTVSLNADVQINKVLYQDFTATAVSGNLLIKDNQLLARNLSFSALGGQTKSELTFSPIATGYVFNLRGYFKDIDISRALLEWNNFGQTTIASDNLKGIASTHIDLTAELNTDYQLLMDKLQVEADIQISDGQLIKFGNAHLA